MPAEKKPVPFTLARSKKESISSFLKGVRAADETISEHAAFKRIEAIVSEIENLLSKEGSKFFLEEDAKLTGGTQSDLAELLAKMNTLIAEADYLEQELAGALPKK